jgi:hypothetical protein
LIRFGYIAAALAAAVPLPAAAQTADQATASGHYEWQATQQPGPRAPLAAPHRVWLADNSQTAANCDCAMMKSHAGNCMTMTGMAPKRHPAS